MTHTPTYPAVSEDRVLPIQGLALKQCNPEDGLCYATQYNKDPETVCACMERIVTTSSVKS